jgi:hypothetical protein
MDRPSLLRQFCLADRITSSASPRPLSGDTPDVRSDFSQRRGSANRARESRAKTRYLHHHEACQQNPSHLAKKNARIASRCAQCDMDVAVLSPAMRLHHL